MAVDLEERIQAAGVQITPTEPSWPDYNDGEIVALGFGSDKVRNSRFTQKRTGEAPARIAEAARKLRRFMR